MKKLIAFEEGAQLLLCLVLLYDLHTYSLVDYLMHDLAGGAPPNSLMWLWWAVPAVLVGPDIAILGYLINTRVGAVCYNITHYKLIAIVVYLVGLYDLFWYVHPSFSVGGQRSWFINIGLIMYAHSSMDRMLGYGLKYADDFKHTHLGWLNIGSQKS